MRKLSITNNHKLNQLVKIAEEFFQIGEKEIFKKIPRNIDFSIPIYVRASLLGRNLYLLETITKLMHDFEKKPTIENSIGLLLRGGLLDMLTIIYLDEYFGKVEEMPSPEEDKYIEVCKSFLADHLYNQINYFKECKDVGNHTKEDYIFLLDSLKMKFPTYFKTESINYDRPKDNISVERFPSISMMVKELRKSDRKRTRFDIDNAYDLYTTYSKYEHFGLFTNGYQTMNPNISFDTLIVGLDYMLSGIILCSLHIDDLYPELQPATDKLNELRSEFARITKIGFE